MSVSLLNRVALAPPLVHGDAFSTQHGFSCAAPAPVPVVFLPLVSGSTSVVVPI